MSGIASVEADIRSAFRAALIAIPSLPEGRKWEGKPYQPVLGVPFIAETVRPIYSMVRGLGRSGNIEHRFNLIVNLNFPDGRGTAAIDTLAGEIRAALAPATSLSYNGTAAHILRTETGPLIEAPDWLTKPVIVTVSTYTTN
jgi:hypothetical protein